MSLKTEQNIVVKDQRVDTQHTEQGTINKNMDRDSGDGYTGKEIHRDRHDTGACRGESGHSRKPKKIRNTNRERSLDDETNIKQKLESETSKKSPGT